MATIFTKLIRGELPSHRIYEDEQHYACLDINPLQPGHALVFPKREVDYLFDMPPDELADLWKAVQTVAIALKKATDCARIVTLVVGYEVPHVHVHLIPTNKIHDYPIPPRVDLDHEQAAVFAEQVRGAF
jgi:histidine triad (HIT) family protein